MRKCCLISHLSFKNKFSILLVILKIKRNHIFKDLKRNYKIKANHLKKLIKFHKLNLINFLLNHKIRIYLMLVWMKSWRVWEKDWDLFLKSFRYNMNWHNKYMILLLIIKLNIKFKKNHQRKIYILNKKINFINQQNK